jgi:hypothetical protein
MGRMSLDGRAAGVTGSASEVASRALGGGHLLVNAAGIPFTAPIAWCPADKWDAALAINLPAAVPAIGRGWGVTRRVAG